MVITLAVGLLHQKTLPRSSYVTEFFPGHPTVVLKSRSLYNFDKFPFRVIYRCMQTSQTR